MKIHVLICASEFNLFFLILRYKAEFRVYLPKAIIMFLYYSNTLIIVKDIVCAG